MTSLSISQTISTQFYNLEEHFSQATQQPRPLLDRLNTASQFIFLTGATWISVGTLLHHTIAPVLGIAFTGLACEGILVAIALKVLHTVLSYASYHLYPSSSEVPMADSPLALEVQNINPMLREARPLSSLLQEAILAESPSEELTAAIMQYCSLDSLPSDLSDEEFTVLGTLLQNNIEVLKDCLRGIDDEALTDDSRDEVRTKLLLCIPHALTARLITEGAIENAAHVYCNLLGRLENLDFESTPQNRFRTECSWADEIFQPIYSTNKVLAAKILWHCIMTIDLDVGENWAKRRDLHAAFAIVDVNIPGEEESSVFYRHLVDHLSSESRASDIDSDDRFATFIDHIYEDSTRNELSMKILSGMIIEYPTYHADEECTRNFLKLLSPLDEAQISDLFPSLYKADILQQVLLGRLHSHPVLKAFCLRSTDDTFEDLLKECEWNDTLNIELYKTLNHLINEGGDQAVLYKRLALFIRYWNPSFDLDATASEASSIASEDDEAYHLPDSHSSLSGTPSELHPFEPWSNFFSCIIEQAEICLDRIALINILANEMSAENLLAFHQHAKSLNRVEASRCRVLFGNALTKLLSFDCAKRIEGFDEQQVKQLYAILKEDQEVSLLFISSFETPQFTEPEHPYALICKRFTSEVMKSFQGDSLFVEQSSLVLGSILTKEQIKGYIEGAIEACNYNNIPNLLASLIAWNEEREPEETPNAFSYTLSLLPAAEIATLARSTSIDKLQILFDYLDFEEESQQPLFIELVKAFCDKGTPEHFQALLSRIVLRCQDNQDKLQQFLAFLINKTGIKVHSPLFYLLVELISGSETQHEPTPLTKEELQIIFLSLNSENQKFIAKLAAQNALHATPMRLIEALQPQHEHCAKFIQQMTIEWNTSELAPADVKLNLASAVPYFIQEEINICLEYLDVKLYPTLLANVTRPECLSAALLKIEIQSMNSVDVCKIAEHQLRDIILYTPTQSKLNALFTHFKNGRDMPEQQMTSEQFEGLLSQVPTNLQAGLTLFLERGDTTVEHDTGLPSIRE